MRFSPLLAVAFCLLAAAVVSPASTSALVMRTTGTQADCQFHQFDFSSMRRDKTMTPPFYNAYYDNYRWQINVCGELEYGAPECEDAGASVCWIDGDVVIGTIQRWNDSTIEWTYYDSENPNWGGVTMSSFNGDPCTGSGGGVPQRVNITFLCNVTQTEFSAVRTPNSCHTEFFVGTPLACGSTSLCGIDNLDFTPLQKSGAQGYYTATDSVGYTYKLNVCGAITGTDDQCGQNSGAVCQYKHGNEVAMVAKWQGAKAVRWSYNPAEGASPAVASVLYTNGDACYPSMQPRTTRINFVCNPTVTPLTVVPSSDPCTYVFQMGTPITCNYARPADTLASAVEKREAQIRMI